MIRRNEGMGGMKLFRGSEGQYMADDQTAHLRIVRHGAAAANNV
jgi:hypothetical protein